MRSVDVHAPVEAEREQEVVRQLEPVRLHRVPWPVVKVGHLPIEKVADAAFHGTPARTAHNTQCPQEQQWRAGASCRVV